MTWNISTIVAEVFYCIIGLIFIATGMKALKDESCAHRTTTALFWFILAFTFIAGPYLPKWITGLCVVFLAILTAFKRVAPSKSDMPKEAETRAAADRLGYSVFIPPLVLAVSAVLVATFLKVLGANNAIGISGSIALVTAFIIFRPKAVYAVKDCTRLTDNVGVTGILPQVLAALGSVFTAAGCTGNARCSHCINVYSGISLKYCSFLYTMHKLYLIFNEVYRVNLKIFWDILGNNFQQFFRKDDIL